MPELPEIETIIRRLRTDRLIGMRITALGVAWERSLYPNLTRFRELSVGRRVTALSRRGKYIVCTLSGGTTIIAHMRMTGRLFLVPHPTPTMRHTRLTLFVTDETTAEPTHWELRFVDPRKFGRLHATVNPERILSSLGVEPLSPLFTPEVLSHILISRRVIKALLLDQHVIAGLGNIYTDEALFAARIHPQRAADTLTKHEVTALHTAIRTVLERGIRNLGTRLGAGEGNFIFPGRDEQAHNQEELAVFQRTGRPCPNCATPIVRLVVAQRGTHICPTCQRLEGSSSP